MRKDLQMIIPGQGLGPLSFGMSRNEIIERLGEPDEKEVSSTSDQNDRTESWHYDQLDLSFGFEEQDDWRLNSISVTSSQYLFEKLALIGKNKEIVESSLHNMGINDLEFEDWSSDESPNAVLLSSEDLCVNFWFDEDILTEIQWTPFFEEEMSTCLHI